MRFSSFLLIFVSMAIHTNELPMYSAKYEFNSDEISIVGKRELIKNQDGYELEFKANNIIASLYFSSKFNINEGTVESKTYEIKVTPRFVNRDQKIIFDYERNIMSSNGREAWEKIFNPDDEYVVDPLNAQIMIRINLKKGLTEFSLNLLEIESGVIEENIYKIIGNETLFVNGQSFDCVVLSRIRKNENRETTYYLAKKLEYMFIKIIDSSPDRTDKLELKELLSFG